PPPAARPDSRVTLRLLACDVTPSPSAAPASSARTSASCRACRRSAAMAGLEKADQTLESQPIAFGAEARHQPYGGVREHRAAPLRLPREDVREMYLHERHAHREQRVAHRETGVREGGGIDHQAIRLPFEPLDRVDQLTLVVGLRPRHLDPDPPV